VGVLQSIGTDWLGFAAAGKTWCAGHPGHEDVGPLTELLDAGDRLSNRKIKSIRQLIPAVLGSHKPWEVHVGQVLGRVDDTTSTTAAHGIVGYVGLDALRAVGLLT
jgi:hypothetical protein